MLLHITVLSGGVFFASLLGTVAGFGSSTILFPMLLLFYPYTEALLFVSILHLFGDIWKLLLFRGRDGINWWVIGSFGCAGAVASFTGARLTFTLPQDVLLRVFALFLLCYIGGILLNPTYKLPRTKTTAVIGGLFSGLIAGLFGVRGAVRAAFLSAYRLPKHSFIFTAGAVAFLIDSVRLATYVSGGMRLPAILWGAMPLFFLISFIGAFVARHVVGFIPELAFRKVILGFLLLLALKFLIG